MHRRTGVRTFDLLVIGGGSAGTAAALVAKRGGAKRVAVAEPQTLGGDCPARACVPTKALLASAARYRAARGSERFGVTGEVYFDWRVAMARKDAVVRDLLEYDEKLYRDAEISVLRGAARFADELAIEIAGERVRAERVVIATGSQPIVPDIPGLRDAAITSERAVTLPDAPRRAFILGGGVVGVEFAQLFHSAGGAVILADRGERLVDIEDPQVSEELLRDLRAQGIDARMGVSLKEVRPRDGGHTVVLDDGSSHDVDLVLAATGRRPAIASLDLAKAGVRTDRGVEAGADLRTSHDRIWAAGDVRGGLLYTHVAAYEGHVAGRNALAERPDRVDLDGIPRITFSDPPVAGVGLGESQARERGFTPVVARGPLTGMGRARVEGWEGGILALVADGPSKRILGASFYGPHADSVVHEVAALIRAGARVGDLGRTIHAYPSWNEVLSGAAAEIM